MDETTVEAMNRIMNEDPCEWYKDDSYVGWREHQEANIPLALTKSTMDSFIFAVGLKTGAVFIYERAVISPCGQWVHLFAVSEDYGVRPDKSANPSWSGFPRGVDIRLSDISWVCDAPYGS